LAERLGLSRADSVPNLTRRLETRLKNSPSLAQELEQIMAQVRAGAIVSVNQDRSPNARGPCRDGEKRARRTKNKI
jgi:hypothetical protein